MSKAAVASDSGKVWVSTGRSAGKRVIEVSGLAAEIEANRLIIED
ncbi:hypothetical protein [Saccharopolyspora antimicrobica]|nr:hypothetical protein [Saccharopolyspora antimicrobica]